MNLFSLTLGSRGCCSSISITSYGGALKHQNPTMGVYHSYLEYDKMIGYRQDNYERYMQYSPLDWWLVS